MRGGGMIAHYVPPASSAPWDKSDVLRSPPRHQSPIMFAPPELAEETLMDVSKERTLVKDCINNVEFLVYFNVEINLNLQCYDQ